MATGFPATLYQIGDLDEAEVSWQVMPEDEDGEVGDFWAWYLDRPQRFPTPESASVAFVQGYRTRQRIEGNRR
jgi:hypothetical protein